MDLCPNCCTNPIVDHPENSCVLGAFIQIVRERANLTEEQVLALHRDANADQLWDDIGPIIDRLEAGHYTWED